MTPDPTALTSMVLVHPTFNLTTQVIAPGVSGLFEGCAYGLIALGIVLLYKSNRIFNFAQAEIASFGGLVTYALTTPPNGTFWPRLPFFVACVLGVSASVVVSLLTERLVIRPLFDRPRVVLVVGTVGVLLLLAAVDGLAVLFGAGSAYKVHSIAVAFGGAQSDAALVVDRVRISYDQVLALAVLVALAIGSLLFFRRTRTGTAILAVSQDPTAARVVGISVARTSQITWGIAGLLAGIAGVVLALQPNTVNGPNILTGTVLVPSIAAAVLGGVTSLSGAFVGGVALGLFEAYANIDGANIPGLAQVPGLSGLAVFLVLLVVLLVRPQGLFGSET